MVFRGIARKRRLREGMVVPSWYLIAARTLLYFGILAFVGFVIVLAGFYVYLAANELAPDPTEFSLKGEALLAVFMFCVLFIVAKRWIAKRENPGSGREDE